MQLHVTPAMRAAWDVCLATVPLHGRSADRQAESWRELEEIFILNGGKGKEKEESGNSKDDAIITLDQVKALSHFYRTYAADEQSATTASTAATTQSTSPSPSPSPSPPRSPSSLIGSGYVYELCRGSRPFIPPPPRRQRDPAFLRYLEEQRFKQERREYLKMVEDLPGNKPMSRDESFGSSYASASRELGQGLNVLTLMATGFVVFYYIGSNFFSGNKVMPAMCGLLGLVGALLLEVCLFVVREQKGEMMKEQQEKMEKAAKRQRQRQEAERMTMAMAQQQPRSRAKQHTSKT